EELLVFWFLIWKPGRCFASVAALATGFKKFRHFLHRVPIARGSGHTQKLFDLTKVTDCFHLATVQAQDESALDCNDLEQPIAIRGETKRNRWQLGCLRFGG